MSNKIAAAALVGAATLAFFTTWFLMSPLVEEVGRSVLMGMVIGNIVIAASFAVLIGVRLWHVLAERRDDLAGSRTHLRLVGIFSLLVVIPAIIAFLFAFTILRTSLNDVFSERIDNYANTARSLANEYWLDQASAAGVNLRQTEYDLELAARFGSNAQTPISFRRSLTEQALVRDLAALIVIDGERNILARIERENASFVLPSSAIFDQIDAAAQAGRPRTEWGNFDANDENVFDYYRGILKIDAYNGGYIISYKAIPPTIAAQLRAVRNIRNDWKEANASRARLERVFFAGYVVLATIILFGAVWAALWAATLLVQPIGRLVNMAERVSSGDLGARVDVFKKDGELGVLARSMNHMTAQLQTQRNDLINTNRQFDERRRFTEAVLSGVSAGVIGLDSKGCVTIANSSAAAFLGEETSSLIGRAVEDIMPELEALLIRAKISNGDEVGDQIILRRGQYTRTLNVRIAMDERHGAQSFVTTFDDITQLIAAQRDAAWGDIARRIAHEIKNPLTPIQLSAERLRRKYLEEVTSSPEIFDKCTETIIRHVKDIGHMVDEFSSFARMPKPVITQNDIREVVRSSVFPQKVAFPDIEYEILLPNVPCIVECDGRLIVQALSNLLKNAGESIGTRAARESEGYGGKIRLSVTLKGDFFAIDILDNGLGLPVAERHRLTEPYMTTREKGTGLGLAIVKKIAEDHQGSLDFYDDMSFGEKGAGMTLRLPCADKNFIDAYHRAAAE